MRNMLAIQTTVGLVRYAEGYEHMAAAVLDILDAQGASVVMPITEFR